MLIIPAVVGIFCVLFGAVTINTPLNQAGREICDEEGMGQTVMCPQCDKFCPYWKLVDSCFLSQVTYLFDNISTLFFSMFMCFWGKCYSMNQLCTYYYKTPFAATTFLSLWKRRQAILQWEWDLRAEEEEDDEVRPEYETGVKTTR